MIAIGSVFVATALYIVVERFAAGCDRSAEGRSTFPGPLTTSPSCARR
jgi:hypothetical protein